MDVSADGEAAPETEPEAEAELGEAFVACEEFDGARDGYTFKVCLPFHFVYRIVDEPSPPVCFSCRSWLDC